MPYITPKQREALEKGRLFTYTAPADSVGELNFLLTREVMDYMCVKGLSYATINDILGALEAVKQEFYRRMAAPYEDKKKEQNGDVYPE